MTPNPQDSAVALEVERAAFEAWAKPLGDSTWREKNDRMLAWDAWQARASQSDGTSGGWISVDERLPEKNERVLVFFAGDLTGIAERCVPWKGMLLWQGHGGSHNQVTHWHPIPAPPTVTTKSQGANHGE